MTGEITLQRWAYANRLERLFRRSMSAHLSALILPAALIFISLGAGAASPGPGGATGKMPDTPATLVVVIPADVVTVDPARYHRHSLTEMVQRHIFRRLLAKEGAGYGPDVAGDFYAEDSLTWVFELHSDVTLHDGTRLTAPKAARFLHRETSPLGIGGYPSPAKERLSLIRDVQAEGGRLVVSLSEPWPALPAQMVREPIGALDERGSPIGTGPFRLMQRDHGNRIILSRVGQPAPGEPASIRFEVVPSSEERLRRVLSGEAHVGIDLPPGALWQLKKSAGVKVVTVPQSRVHFMEFDATRPPFDDRRVRHAFNLAVDTSALIGRVMQEHAQPVATLLSPITLGYDETVAQFGYDPIRAGDLLTEAGYPNGFEIELDVTAHKRRIGEIYRDFLADVGVKVILRTWSDWASLREQILLGRRQAWVGEWGNSSMDPGSAIWPKLHSQGEANYGSYRDETLDALLEQAEATVDPDERLERYRGIQRYLRQRAPMLFGYVVYDVYGAAADLDWTPGPEGWLDLGKARWRRQP